MRNAQSRRASGGLYSVACTFIGLLLASCTSSNDPNLELNSTAFNSASMTAPDVEGQSEQTVGKVQAAEDKNADVPGAVSLASAADNTSNAASKALKAEVDGDKPIIAEAGKPLPPNIASTRRENGSATAPLVTASTNARSQTAQAYAPNVMSTRSQGAAQKKPLFGSVFGSSAGATDAAAPVLHEQAVKPVIDESAGQAFIKNVPAKTFVENLPGKPIIDLDKKTAGKPVVLASLGEGGNGLPGVRVKALFEIKRKSGIDDDSDVDVHEEDDAGLYSVASAAGMARLAPNGLLKQTESVDVACLKPSLVRVLKTVESRYGKKLIVTSGYRSRLRNIQARGAKNSLHMYCAAADIQVPGVSKIDLANFLRSMPGRGGVGTYCHTNSVHVDVGPERDWNWNCRRRG